MTDADEQERKRIMSWRRETRRRLTAERLGLPAAERQARGETAAGRLEGLIDLARFTAVGLYWPTRGEIDLRPMARRLIAAGTRVAVPVIVEKNAPVAFREWTPGCRMEKGFWDIPVPADTDTLNPGALVVPLVGFDEAGYRLGHGGGYYDRTLAALNPRPVAIGLGLELGRLPSIEPLPHDIPMHAIVTEAGAWRYERPAAAIADEDDVEAASPTCLLSEVGFGSEVPWR